MGKQIIKFDQNICNADINDNSVLFVRVDGAVNDKDAIIEVPFTHNAFVIKGGGDCKFYKSGSYPVFESAGFFKSRAEVKDWKNGMSVEVVYIPKDTCVPILWGTPDKVRYRDARSGKVVNVGARGRFDAVVTNPEQFFRKVVGARREFDKVDFCNRFSAAVVSEFSDCFLHVVDEEGLGYDRFDLNKKRIGARVGEILSEKFDKTWGIGLSEFIIEAFIISVEDMSAVESVTAEEQRRKQEAERRAEAERLDDKQWEREKYMMQLELQNKMAYYDAAKTKGDDEKKKQFCERCGNEYKPTDTFCPHCGNRVSKTPIICKECGKSNDYSASFCSGCGKKL